MNLFKNKKAEKSSPDVAKMQMDDEIKTLLGNVMSNVKQLASVIDNGQVEQKAEDEDRVEVMDGEAEKAIETTNPEGAGTANDDAEERIDEADTTINDDSLSEVAKQFLAAMKTMNAVAEKSNQPRIQDTPEGQVLKSIELLANSQKQIHNELQETQKALASVLEGYGIAEEIKKAAEVNTSKSKPAISTTSGNNEWADALKSLVAKSGQERDHSENLSPFQTAMKSQNVGESSLAKTAQTLAMLRGQK